LLPFVFFLFMYFLIKDVVVVKEGLINCTGLNWLSYGSPAACATAQNVEAAMAAEQKRQQEAIAAAKAAADKARADAKAAAEKKQREEAAAEKKRQEEAAALAKCNGCLAKKTRSQCTPTYCKA
jgi:hypothetical protein